MKFLEVHSVKGKSMALLLIQLKIQLKSSALKIQFSFVIQYENNTMGSCVMIKRFLQSEDA